MAGRLAEDEPETAYRHAKAARRLASRVGLVREAAGLAAYHAGEWAEALAELRAARRLSTTEDAYLPVMADCERGLGRPERALDLVKSPEAKKLDQAGRVELRMVESGARRDLGQYDAAVVALQVPELRDRRLRPWSARLFYAYADALADAGRQEEAVEWFARAAAADRDGETDAAERYAELEGLHIFDTEEGEAAGGTDAAGPTDLSEPTDSSEPAGLSEASGPSAAEVEGPLASTESVQDGSQAPAGGRPAPEAPEDAQSGSAPLAGPADEAEAEAESEGEGEGEGEGANEAADEAETEGEGVTAPTAIEFKAAPAVPEPATGTTAETPSGASQEEQGDPSDEDAPVTEVPEAPAVFLEPQAPGEPEGRDTAPE
ncbi:hypothetical protein [Actinomadura viridis]|uniref:Tetratricopeptide repeat protein n=1 Tax=Actinomadura viridis TaxID=58110 RepID=A0A931DN73_9ACTN|nr:hypothetical protein [Actinomadura viridis]MBG6090210.1 hypothetical protein [Actinomadura viridis]